MNRLQLVVEYYCCVSQNKREAIQDHCRFTHRLQPQAQVEEGNEDDENGMDRKFKTIEQLASGGRGVLGAPNGWILFIVEDSVNLQGESMHRRYLYI